MSHALTKTYPLAHQVAKEGTGGSERLRKVVASKQQLTWYPLTIDGKENIPAEATSYQCSDQSTNRYTEQQMHL